MKYLKLFESFSKPNLIVVDIQPEYEDYYSNTFQTYEFCEYINSISGDYNLTFLYNGFDTLGMVSESDYQLFLMENGLNEDIIDDINFYDKGYAFFRYCIDEDVPQSQIVNFVKYMYKNNINDSRDLDEDNWEEYLNNHVNDEQLVDALKDSVELFYIPDLMSELKDKNNIVLIGGGIDECLKEVEIALQALGKSYSTNDDFIY